MNRLIIHASLRNEEANRKPENFICLANKPKRYAESFVIILAKQIVDLHLSLYQNFRSS